MTCYSPRTYRIRKKRFAISCEDDLSDKITSLELFGIENIYDEENEKENENNVHKNIFDKHLWEQYIFYKKWINRSLSFDGDLFLLETRFKNEREAINRNQERELAEITTPKSA